MSAQEATKIFQEPMPTDPNTFDPGSPHVDEWVHVNRYLRSLAEYTPFFTGLANKRFLVTRCVDCPYWGRTYTYATPRPGLACMYCGRKCEWIEIEPRGAIHSWTICYFAGEMFKEQVPFALVLVAFPGVDTLFLSQLRGVPLEQPAIQDSAELEAWIKSFIGRPVRAQFRKLIEPKKFDPTDVWFVLV